MILSIVSNSMDKTIVDKHRQTFVIENTSKNDTCENNLKEFSKINIEYYTQLENPNIIIFQ
jgi:hypothetical protein